MSLVQPGQPVLVVELLPQYPADERLARLCRLARLPPHLLEPAQVHGQPALLALRVEVRGRAAVRVPFEGLGGRGQRVQAMELHPWRHVTGENLIYRVPSSESCVF